MSPSSHKLNSLGQRGMTLILTLLLMLSLTMMASAVIMVVNNHADLSASVTQKPLAMKAAETCVDQAIGWLLTPGGTTWAASGVGVTTDIAAEGGILYGKSLTDDTSKVSDTRTDKFKVRTNKSACTSVIITVLAEESSAGEGASGIGSEAGSVAAYDGSGAASAVTYIIKVVAEGIFNTPTLLGGTVIDKTNWEAGSSRGKVEILLQYTI